MSEFPNIIIQENVVFVPGQGILPVFILNDKFCEEQAFPHLFLQINLAITILKIVQYVHLGTSIKGS